MNPEQSLELHDWRIAKGTNQGGPNAQKIKKWTKDYNGKGKFKKGRQNNNAWNKLKPKVLELVKSTETRAKEDVEKDDVMTARICEALISFSSGNKPPKTNGGPKNDAMVSEMKLRAIIKNHEKEGLS